MGTNALLSDEGAYGDTAAGFAALYFNTSGSNNTAAGTYVLTYSTGNYNTASGANALFGNTTGSNNTAFGYRALTGNVSGSNNIALGVNAGDSISGSDNIDIGNEGVAAENGVIRIGTAGTQTHAYIAGIRSSQVTGSAVYVTAGGKLGVLASSERFKTSIVPMGSKTEKLRRLRPVTFHLESDPQGAAQYGLIAEEVAEVYPELVIRDQSGRIDGVRYDELAPMLLNEVQHQQLQLAQQQQKLAEVDQLRQQVAELKRAKESIRAANETLQGSIAKLLAKDERLARQ
jgi:hypothetical protein